MSFGVDSGGALFTIKWSRPAKKKSIIILIIITGEKNISKGNQLAHYEPLIV